MVTMTRAQAESFYDVHRERPFYDSLVAFMTSGPCVPMALEASDAVRAAPRSHRRHGSGLRRTRGTVRALYAESKERNAVHGSDSDDNARREIGFFFAEVRPSGVGVP